MVGAALFLTLVGAARAQPTATPELSGSAAVVHAERLPVEVRWEGGPASVRVREGRRWTTVAHEVTSPVRTPPIPVGAQIALQPAEGPPVLLDAWQWTPADVAAWSGPGLRGARVVGLGGNEEVLWVATHTGGLAAWDGRAWTHHGRRGQLGTEVFRGLHVAGDVRWLAVGEEVLRLDPDGTLTRHPAHDLPDEAPLDAAGVPRLTGAWPVEDAVAMLPRVGGAWLVSPTQGLLLWLDGALSAHWTPPLGQAVDLVRLGDGMLVAAGAGGAWHVLPSGVHRIARPEGLPGAALRLGAGPLLSRAWVGTDRGVALVTAGRAVTVLPRAPLPADVPIRACVSSGRSVAVASDDGLVWVGPGEPLGFAALAAATGPAPLGLVEAGDRWWAAREEALWWLDRRGTLQRWDAGAPILAMDRVGDGLVIAVEDGLRVWLPGASVPSTLIRMPGVVDVAGEHDGTVWVLDGEGISRLALGGALVHHALEGGQAIVDDPLGGAWVRTAAGLVPVPLSTRGAPGAPQALAAAGGSLVSGGWQVDEVGTVRVQVQGAAPERVGRLDSSVPTTICADRDGAWIGTDRGLYRFAAPVRSGGS